MSKSPSLVFFGSGPVAAKSLELLAQDFDIEAVITKPKPAHHRGEAPVIITAEKLRLPIFTAANKRSLDELFNNQAFKSPAGVLIDFGIIVSPKVIDSFALGIINSHFSILPQWRGADPITFSILSGQKTTGVSLMLVMPALDEGELLAYGQYDMPADITTPQLTEHLIELSDSLLSETLPKYLRGELQSVPQTVTGLEVSYSRKLSKADGLLDLNKPADQLEREVRAFLGWPKSRIQLFGHDVIVTKARIAQDMGDGALVLAANPGYLEIVQLIAPSGRTMLGADFLRGYKN